MPDHVIQVEDISTYRTRVLVKSVPLEIDNEMLKDLFGKFGNVSRVSYMRKNYNNNKWNHAVTDRRVVWMTLDTTIPTSLFINQTQTFINVRHDNQPQTCNRCGHQDHFRKECKTRFEKWLNVVDIDISEYNWDNGSTLDSDMEDEEGTDIGDEAPDQHIKDHIEEEAKSQKKTQEDKNIENREISADVTPIIEEVSESFEIEKIFDCRE